MKLLLLALCAASAVLVAAKVELVRYHEQYGIPTAARIKEAEERIVDNINNINTVTSELANKFISNPPSIADPGAFPYVGGLVITMTTGPPSVCSSALISTTRALTAAHCWWDGYSRAKQFTVVLGSNRLFMGGTRVTTDNVAVHADWNPLNDATNDIAMISFSAVELTKLIKPVKLPAGSQLQSNFAGESAIAAGFGKTTTSTSIASRFLHHVDMQIITNSVCEASLPIEDSMLCTTGAGGGTSCGGDSGGPLVVKSGSESVLVGVTSIGSVLACQDGLPSVFTRVTSFTTWINSRLA